MNPRLLVLASDGSTKADLVADRISRTAAHREFDRGTATVARSDWSGTSVDSRNDRLRLERPDGTRLFEGRFDDDEFQRDNAVITIVSFGRDALDAKPTSRSKTFVNVSDQTVVRDAVDAVDTLSRGTIDELVTGISYEFPSAARSKQLLKAAESSGGVYRFNGDQSVDYQSRFGSDRTLTLSPANQNLVGEPTVSEDVRDEITHVRAFGSRQGNLVREAVADSFSGGREVWREFEDTDIRSPDRLQQIADRLVAAYDGEPRKITVEATTTEPIFRGDVVPVSLPDRDIDRSLTCKRVTERLDESGRLFDVELVSRLVDDDLQGNRREALQRFNRGFQGFVDRDNDSYGWQPVATGVNAQRQYFYPSDVVSEERAEIVVNSVPYRAYTQGGASGGGFSQTSAQQDGSTLNIVNTPGLGSDTTLTPGDSVDISATVDSSFDGYVAFLLVEINEDNFNRRLVGVELDGPNQRVIDGQFWTDEVGNLDLQASDPNVQPGDEIILTITNPTSASSDIVLDSTTSWTLFQPTHTHTVTFPNHTHPVQPGLKEFSSETAESADLLVNQELVATDIGSGEFTTVVDASGEFVPGDNTITLGSDTLGLVNLTVRTELFRKG